jgi:putative LysE/RhtB family amino acid efflux pump
MNCFLLFQAIALGFLVATAIGPIALLCIGKTIREGFLMGIAAGCGVACADALYAGIAIGGIAALAHIVLDFRIYVQLGFSIYLIYLGITIALQDDFDADVSFATTSYSKTLVTTFLLTLANPTTILGFVTLLTSFNMLAQTPLDALLIVSGVCIGSLSWWIILAVVGHVMSRTINRKLLHLLHKISGYAIISVGTIALANAVYTLILIIFFLKFV